MPLIGAALGDLVEHCAADTVLRREIRGADLHLRHGFEGRNVHIRADRQVGGGAVLKKIVVEGEIAVNSNCNSRISRLARSRGLRRRARSAGKQICEAAPVLAVGTDLRQIHHGLCLQRG